MNIGVIVSYNKLGVAVLVGVALAGAGATWWGSSSAAAKRAVQGELKDPSSAIFTALEPCKGPNGLAYVTGFVNARNSFGGMTGKQRFLVEFDEDGAPSVTIANDDPDDDSSQFFAELAEVEGSSTQDCYVLPAIARSNALAAKLSDGVDIDNSDVAAMAAADAVAGAADAAALDAAAYEAALSDER